MLNLDKTEVDKLLLQLEEIGFFDNRYRFYKVNNELCLLGTGNFSYVYEMYDVNTTERHYAAKIIGLGNRDVDDKLVLESTQIQYFLGQQSENILRVIDLWIMKLIMDAEGNVLKVVGKNQKEYNDVAGFTIQVVLMERLSNIISRDKYGKITLLREELKTETGIIKFAENIGKALFIVHNNGFLHRDVKLENIFWDEDNQQYKLGDFGVARFVGGGDAETVVFTDGYGAPEIERQLEFSYNAPADIYSFGITLFLLLNDLKFPASDGYYANIVQYSKDFIVPAPVNASERMAKIIRKMCSYRVEDRYQSIEEVFLDIGRIDDSYTNNSFTEYDDISTQTYSETNSSTTETYRETYDDEVINVQNDSEEVHWLEKEDCKLNREERKKREQLNEKVYRNSSIWRICISTVLFMLLFKSLSPDAAYIGKWQFWTLPIAMLFVAILQSIKEFHIVFEIITIGMAVYSMYVLGVDVPQITMIFIAFLGIPAITAGCAIGTFLWIAQMMTGKFAWISIFESLDLGWLVLIILIAVIDEYFLLRVYFQKETTRKFIIWVWIIDKIWLLMIGAEIVLSVLGHYELIIIPEIFKKIHLIRIGVGIFIYNLFEY